MKKDGITFHLFGDVYFCTDFFKSKFARLGIDILFSCFFTKEKHKLSPSLPAMNSGCVCGWSRVVQGVQDCLGLNRVFQGGTGWSRVGRVNPG